MTSDEQPRNVNEILVRPFPSTANLKDSQPLKVELPISVTLSGTVTVMSELQPSKAKEPIVSIPSPRWTETSESQLKNAKLDMLLTVPGIVTDSRFLQISNA